MHHVHNIFLPVLFFPLLLLINSPKPNDAKTRKVSDHEWSKQNSVENIQCFTPKNLIRSEWIVEDTTHIYRPIASKGSYYDNVKGITGKTLKTQQRFEHLCFKRTHSSKIVDGKKYILQKFSMFGKDWKNHYNITLLHNQKEAPSKLNYKENIDKKMYTIWKNQSESIYLVLYCTEKHGMIWFTASQTPTIRPKDKNSIVKLITKLGFNPKMAIESSIEKCNF